MILTSAPLAHGPLTAEPATDPASARLRDAATRLESLFLAEMLKSAGLGQARSSFGGGIGEEHFASFLADAQAQELARAGGIGLAETLFRAMAGAQNDD